MKNETKYIPGIHNYCDRWCERCDFRTRCASFASMPDMQIPEFDLNNDAFWKAIGDNFKKTESLIFDEAARQGIDVDEIIKEKVQSIKNGGLKVYMEGREHPLGKISYEYVFEVDQFFKKYPIIQEKGNELMRGLKAGILNVKQTKKEIKKINECVEIIFQYLMFIHIKLMRAINGFLDCNESEEEQGYQRDFDGSAKIALIVTQRSLGAWSKINELIPGYEDEILPILARLQSVIRMINEVFPKAIDFIRPGFDERLSINSKNKPSCRNSRT